VRQVTRGNETVAATFVYDAFGNVTSSSGSVNLKNKYVGKLGYRDDGDLGLMHVGARYYDPDVGRFITRDPVLSEHPYVYCGADPVNCVDPSGRFWVEVVIVGGIVIVVGYFVYKGIKSRRPKKPTDPVIDPVDVGVGVGTGAIVPEPGGTVASAIPIAGELIVIAIKERLALEEALRQTDPDYHVEEIPER
jgi:RHS repeat-associated protein